MTDYTCLSCEHSRHDGKELVCSVTGWPATKRCPAFERYAGAMEPEDDAEGDE